MSGIVSVGAEAEKESCWDMGGQGYLRIVENKVSVADIKAAYEALSNAVENRKYNFGELKLGKNNQLEIINNHKNTFFHSNNTITSAVENKRAREAAFAILDAMYKGTVDADTLALVRNFLCGDKTIAAQPLTRDEVANMIKLLKMPKGTVSKDSALDFLKASYEFKHGLVDGAFVPGLDKLAHAEENRISDNVLRANERQQAAQMTELKGLFKDGAKDDQILRTVLRNSLSNPYDSPSMRLFASLHDPARLSVAEDAKTYLRNAVAVYVRESIGQSPKGPEFLGMMMQQRSADIARRLGGDEQAAGLCLHGKYAAAFKTMQGIALTDMRRDNVDDHKANKCGWTSVVSCFSAIARKSMLDGVADGQLKNRAVAKLRADFGKLMELPKSANPDDLRAAFAPIAGALSHPDLKDGFDNVFRAFFDSGGDLERARAELGELKGMLSEKLERLDGELKGMETEATNAKGVVRQTVDLSEDDKTRRCKTIDDNLASSRDSLVRREQPFAEAATLVEFIDTLLERNDGKARDFLRALTFASPKEVVPSRRPEAFEVSMVAGWLEKGGVDSALDDFRQGVEEGVAACRNGKADDRSLNELMKTCERQLDSFCEKALAPVAWGKEQPGSPPPVYTVVEESSRELLKAYQQSHGNVLVSDSELEEALAKAGKDKVDPEALRKELTKEKMEAFKSLRKEFLGIDSAVEQKKEPVAPAKEVKVENKAQAQSVDKDAKKRLEQLAKAYSGFAISAHESVDAKLGGLLNNPKSSAEVIQEAQNEVIEEIARIQAGSKDKVDIVGAAKLLLDSIPYVESDTDYDKRLGHEMIELSNVIGAFSKADSAEVNARILGVVQERCEKDFGMSKEELRAFVDPAVVAIVAQLTVVERFEDVNEVPSERQLDRIMQCAITKAKSVLDQKESSVVDRNRARSFLWRMQESVKAARGQLAAQFWPLVRTINPNVSDGDFEQKLETEILRQKDNDRAGGLEEYKLAADISKLLVNGNGEESDVYSYDEVKTKTFMKIKYQSKETHALTTNLSDSVKFSERVEVSKKFWQGMYTFLHRLDRLQATMTKCGVNVSEKESGIDKTSRMFVNKVRARFRNTPLIQSKEAVAEGENVAASVNEERFKSFVNGDSGKNNLRRTKYSLSFVF